MCNIYKNLWTLLFYSIGIYTKKTFKFSNLCRDTVFRLGGIRSYYFVEILFRIIYTKFYQNRPRFVAENILAYLLLGLCITND